METPAFEKSFKGAFIWFLWKIGFVTYVLTSALPMIGFICCLFIIAIKRDAPILISIIMMIMLHPMFTLIIGSSTQTMGKFSDGLEFLFASQIAVGFFFIHGKMDSF